MLIKDDKNIYFCRDYFLEMKFFKGANFRSKIFFAIVMVNLLFMMAMVAFDLYKDIAWLQSVKKQNLIRIETKIQQVFDKTARQNGGEKWEEFQEELGKLVWADNIKIAFYDLKGNLIFGQKNETLSVNDLEKLKANYRFFVEKKHNEEVSYHLFDFIYEGKKPNEHNGYDEAVFFCNDDYVCVEWLCSLVYFSSINEKGGDFSETAS